jgi:hypothetical protein
MGLVKHAIWANSLHFFYLLLLLLFQNPSLTPDYPKTLFVGMLFFLVILEFWMMDKVHKPSDCPSSEPLDSTIQPMKKITCSHKTQ